MGFVPRDQVVPGSVVVPDYDDTHRPFTPTGTSANPIVIASRSPQKKRRNIDAKTRVNKNKKRCRPLSPVAILPLRNGPQRGRAQTPSTGPWPTVVISDSSEEETLQAMLQDSAPTVDPASMIDLTAFIPSPISPSQPSRGRGCHGHRTRRAAAPASPRFTSPPDDMFLPNTPPAGESASAATATRLAPSVSSSRHTHRPAAPPSPRFTSPPDDMFLPNTPPARESASATTASGPAPSGTASVPQRDPSPDDMFLSDSSEELPMSIIPPMSTPNFGNRQAASSASNVALTLNTASASSMPALDGNPFILPHTPRGPPRPSPFAHLTPSQFDKFIMTQLSKSSGPKSPSP